MPRTDIEIINKLGLHARASAKLAELANRFPCEIWLERNGRRVNAKSIMGILMLAAAKGTTVTVETQGEEAEAALAAIVDLVQNRFGEPE
ncbi:HPr family phosphocarrier protein [Hydrogenophilus thermoluteolus]|jgi:phosphocarrier protein|uniref:Phosphotransferase system, phosphocarrier protein HPr n=1 Tax=Hydrogenophilus thermoluteolus TaxID=297 RepID=A0A2Z6E190_HYDTE|nr:HPr family phosphocarrier protein [Hydrogenophilus thermoluteolus]MBW7656973.1 HPr family phosphocarrier protein [Hydrogenophilus thermoluteolus]BBD78262.1 phosphotransferase system, phosphocarrier protein HPr [Hydrogenophilus thermoluteolus]GLW60423.1 phosphocarrier protein HPr [Hydrogenophilus thermoluteolus]HNQ48115.1 HPr family phosphocarrier protein [Hydrogenophilus thermoluteolus]HNU19980.1 HPr family phosphocarrier protein [Hydrogenophilus thermoluteolus]